MANASLSLLVLKTRQVAALRKMYGAIGIPLVEERHGKGPVHCAGRIGDLTFEIYPLPEDDTAVDSATRLGFVVESLFEVIKALEVLATPVIARPSGTERGLRAIVRDPDGRTVELHQR